MDIMVKSPRGWGKLFRNLPGLNILAFALADGLTDGQTDMARSTRQTDMARSTRRDPDQEYIYFDPDEEYMYFKSWSIIYPLYGQKRFLVKITHLFYE